MSKLPSPTDPRLHVSLVLLTIQVLGQVAYGFDVSVAQILVAVGAAAGLELAVGIVRDRVVVWPASALLTGSGVALVFRVLGTEHGQWFSLRGWYLFALVSAGSLVSKYLVRYRGVHLFNPSNVGLVVAFCLLGGNRVEPLDLWWVPLGLPMALGYVVILAGGLAIDRRLRLLELAATAWAALAFGTAVLALSGHAITARWSLLPLSGSRFWWVVMTSPEVLIFVLFMITDPRTVPASRGRRLLFGLAVGLASAVLMAPAGTEFGTKVGLLGGLVVVGSLRPLAARAASLPLVTTWPYAGRAYGAPALVVAGALGVASAAILSAATFGGQVATAVPDTAPRAPDPPGAPVSVPTPTVDPVVAGLSSDLATEQGAADLAEVLAFNLSVEAEAIMTGDATLLDAVDHGRRLDELQASITRSAGDGTRVVPTYRFDSLHLTIVYPGKAQDGPNAGLVATGQVIESTYRDGELVDRAERPFRGTFALRAVLPGRWFVTDLLPPEG